MSEGNRSGRFAGLSGTAQGAAYVSIGSLMLVVMAALAKFLGHRIPSFELLFFRSAVGLAFVLPFFVTSPLEPFRTKRFGMHFLRGATGALGNACFFWTITHMLLADSMALQFSRPLFMIPLALWFLREKVSGDRIGVAVVGFLGILLYARPFTSGFDPNALVGATGAFFGGLVVVCIKRLSSTESTRVIMFYYAVWNAIFALIPALFIWIWPTWGEFGLLCILGFLGISGQGLITKGLSLGDATALAPLDYSRIVYASVIGLVLFGEMPGLWSLAGMSIVVAASIYLVLSEKRRSRAGTIPGQASAKLTASS